MAQDSPQTAEKVAPRRKRRIGRWILLTFLLVNVIGAAWVWLNREELAADLITDTLEGYGVRATYTIESIEPDRQVITDIVVGDPDRPDLTIERAELRVEARLGLPGVGELTLIRPRLFGTYIDGELSFGELDPLLFAGEQGPFEFPDLIVHLDDGRALIEGDRGPVALRLAGEGHLRGGFAGEIAVVAPQLVLPGCSAEQATLFGEVSIDAERPKFDGPLRFSSLACKDTGLSIADGGLQIEARADRNLEDFEGSAGMESGRIALTQVQMAGSKGSLDFTFRGGDLTAQFGLQGRDITNPNMRAALFEVDGLLRTREDFANLEIEAEMQGRNVLPGQELLSLLGAAVEASEGSLAQDLLERFRTSLASELQGNELSGRLTGRREGEQMSLVIPEARLRGRSGASVLALSRFQAGLSEEGVPVFTGNFSTGGAGLPRIAGNIDQPLGGLFSMRLVMEEYAAGQSRIALPRLNLDQQSSGSYALSGDLRTSGPLPGGIAENLELPISGTIAGNGDIALWHECTPVVFDRVELSNLALDRHRLDLCPPSGSSILAYDANGLQLAAGVPSLGLNGMLGETPIQIESGPVGMAYPGVVTASQLNVALGPQGSTMRFAIEDLSARLGEDELGGTFNGTDVLLTAVPLDILQAGGNWSYGDDGLVLSGARFILEDREQEDRFKPLLARGARLSMLDNGIATNFTLRNPATDSEVTDVAIIHDLETGAGSAVLDVEGVTFHPNGLQPRDLSELAYGVVSLVDGTVTGEGRIDWTEEEITSSGSFSSESLDLAAAFGPVQGASGTVHFTDLLGLTTAPNQRIAIRAINPGIEVTDGEVGFSLTDGTVLRLEDASWPFLGGRLSMRPLTMNIGASEVRRYVFQIEGLEASRFVEHMELNNLAATGTFDGSIPIVFDEMGNGQLESGTLSARPPGGNVSYVGQLTYEDLSAIGNFAFSALRDLQYNRMEIVMNGPLTGELVTQVRFDGIRQGETAQTNFITRQIAKLPIRLLVNVRAPFYQLMSTTRSLYDPSAVRDPRSLGLLTDDGMRLRQTTDFREVEQREAEAAAAAEGSNSDESAIQPPESEATP